MDTELIMPLTKLQFKPGINREITKYSNEGGWVDCDKIRFRFGYPEESLVVGKRCQAILMKAQQDVYITG